MTSTETIWFEVSGEWLKACGYGDAAKAFPVLRSYDRGMMAFVDLDMGEGRVWTVNAEWRGRFVNPPAAVDADPTYNAAIYAGHEDAPATIDGVTEMTRTTPTSTKRPFLSLKRVGGLTHWRIGTVGGSWYGTQRHGPLVPLAFAAVAIVAMQSSGITQTPVLIGHGCDGTDGPIWAMHESDFPRCDRIERSN